MSLKIQTALQRQKLQSEFMYEPLVGDLVIVLPDLDGLSVQRQTVFPFGCGTQTSSTVSDFL